MNILAITSIVLHLSTWSIDVYVGNKLAAHCTTQWDWGINNTAIAKVACEAPRS